MNEQPANKDWSNSHQKATAELEIIIRTDIKPPAETAQQSTGPPPEADLQYAVMDKVQATLHRILASMKEGKPDPESVFQKGLAALADIDRERFVIENLLESVKRGESLAKTLTAYRSLNLTDIEVTKAQSDDSGTPRPSIVGAGDTFLQCVKWLKTVATKIIHIIINAMKMTPKFVGIKPSIGWSGLFPSFSLQFDLEAKSLNLHDLFHGLTEGLSGVKAR